MKIENTFVPTAAVEMLDGLTPAESLEFHELDATMPFGGLHVWPSNGLPCLPSEQRWLALWQKHQAAVAVRGR